MMVMFAFEFAILLITSLGIMARYALSLTEKYILHKEALRRKAARAIERAAAAERRQSLIEQIQRRRAAGEAVEDPEEEDDDDDDDDDELDVGGWEDKGTWVFYSELSTDFLKLLTYLSFFSIVLTWYGLPLHIIRDVYLTLRSFITRIRDFIRYRRATAHMNLRYPDATPAEVEQGGVCIICREEMRPWNEEAALGMGGRVAGTQDQRHRPKRLPCGHVLHFACLRSWLERQQRCPTCRRPVLEENSTTDVNAEAVPGNGIAFQAQFGIGPLGFDIGVGGPGVMQNMLNRLNQQNQANQPQIQPGQQQQQPVEQLPQNPLQADQGPNYPQTQPAQPAQPHYPHNQSILPNQLNPNSTPSEIQQHIIRTLQTIERETAMLQVSHRQLQQLQQLYSAANTASISVTPATTASLGNQTSNTTSAGVQFSPATFEPSSSQSPGGVQSVPVAASQDILIPPGWSLFPLSVLETGMSAAQGPPVNPSSGITLASGCFADPSPLGMMGPLTRTIQVPDNSRLTPNQRATLSPLKRASVSALSCFLASHLDQERIEYVCTVLDGLPNEIRQEILEGWPDVGQAQQLRGSIAKMEQLRAKGTFFSQNENIRISREEALRAVVSLIVVLARTERIMILLGLPVEFRNSVMDRTENPAGHRLDVERLEGIMSDNDQPASTTQEDEHLAIGRTCVETLDEAARQMREAAASLERTAQNSAFTAPTPSIFGNNNEPLSLFGERSVFPLDAQEHTLKDFEKELMDREQEWEAKTVIEGMLSGNSNSGITGTGIGSGSGTGGGIGEKEDSNTQEDKDLVILAKPDRNCAEGVDGPSVECSPSLSSSSHPPPTAEEKGKWVDRD